MSIPPRPATRICVAAFVAIVASGALLAASSGLAQDGDGKGESYGGTPERLRPFAGAGEPARRFFTVEPQFRGPGREEPVPADLDAVRIGVLMPQAGRHKPRGARMIRGIRLAIDDANRAGGYAKDVPFEILVRSESESWGAAASAAVEMVQKHGVVGIVGALDDAASHVVTRVLLKIEVPLVNTSGVDPTLTEHAIPWLVRIRPDDRQGCYRLAKRMFDEDGCKRVVVFRENSRYARMGIGEYVDAARRLGHPIALEVRYQPHEKEWAPLLERVRGARPDALFIWGDGKIAGQALAEVRKAGIDVPIYGPERLADPECLAAAGKAAEGVIVTRPFDPVAGGAAWTAFATRYRARFEELPDVEAAYGYDGTLRLIEAIREVGPNRPLIRDALFAKKRWSGVTGESRLDLTGNDVREMVIAVVTNGRPVIAR